MEKQIIKAADFSMYSRFVIVDDAYPAARVPSTVPTSLLKRARFNQSISDLKQDFKVLHVFKMLKTHNNFSHTRVVSVTTSTV